jgi:hypothetical protein
MDWNGCGRSRGQFLEDCEKQSLNQHGRSPGRYLNPGPFGMNQCSQLQTFRASSLVQRLEMDGWECRCRQFPYKCCNLFIVMYPCILASLITRHSNLELPPNHRSVSRISTISYGHQLFYPCETYRRHVSLTQIPTHSSTDQMVTHDERALRLQFSQAAEQGANSNSTSTRRYWGDLKWQRFDRQIL